MIKILDANGDSQEVEVIRYFKSNGADYLLYALNEVDEQDYLKLYGLKIENAKGLSIPDDEWALVKDEIKKIIKGNKEGNLEVEDLDFTTLEGITSEESRAFKLSTQLVELLGSNKKEFPKEEVSETVAEEPVVEEKTDFDLGLEPETEETEAEEPVQSFDFGNEEGNEMPKFDFEATEEESVEAELPESEEVNVEPELPTAEEVSEIEPTVVASFDDEEISSVPEDKQDFETLYNEEKELNEVLKSEIDQLRSKINKIAQFISE